jgi:peptidoglycan/LPS O-acetylase OafA/YrhL
VVSHTLPFTLGASTFASAIGMGNIAVMGFFVLSGFIITEASCAFYRGRPLAFIVNRFWRIAPPYWLAVGISIGVHYWLKQAELLRFADQVDAQAGMFGLRNIVSNVFAIFPFQGEPDWSA